MKVNAPSSPNSSTRQEPARNRLGCSPRRFVRHAALCTTLTVLSLSLCFSSVAQTTTVTSNPANGATGVSVSAPVVFTFSAAVDPTSVTASFYSLSPFGSYPVTDSWNADNTVLTCTPVSSFPSSVSISWVVAGMDTGGGQVVGQGSFTTGTGGGTGGGGSGTNAFTSFSVGKLYLYDQLSAGAPTPNPDAAYGFFASSALASNRTATAVTVTIPNNSTPVALTQNILHHEDYYSFSYNTNQTAFETAYPQGGYVFNVTGTPNNLQVTDTLPSTMAQPNAPHVSNFAAAQAVNSSQAFTLSWDAFQNGTASDFITVQVSDGAGKTLFQTPDPGTNGALTGVATSVSIPANTLAAGTTNTAEIAFYRLAVTTNAASAYATIAYRTSATQLNLLTTASVIATTPVVSNPAWGGNGFGFDVATSVNQNLVVRYSTDLSNWQTLYTTNSPGTSIHVAVPTQLGASAFFRVENGP